MKTHAEFWRYYCHKCKCLSHQTKLHPDSDDENDVGSNIYFGAEENDNEQKQKSRSKKDVGSFISTFINVYGENLKRKGDIKLMRVNHQEKKMISMKT